MTKRTDNNQPATKKDVQEAQEELALSTKRGFDAVDKRFEKVEEDTKEIKQDVSVLKQDVSVLKKDVSALKKDVTNLKEGQKAILSVVQSIDQQLQEYKTHPTRINRLERTVFH